MSVVRDHLVRLQPLGQCGMLAALLLVALVLVLPFAFWLGGPLVVGAAAAAAAVVWVASALGIAVGELFRKPNDVLVAMLFGMAIRMTLPLAACVIVHLSGGPLAAAGFVFFVLGFYMIALAADTLLLVLQLNKKTSS
jgi:hypothetical protein